MTSSIRKTCRVGPDGILEIPLGKEEAGAEVVVTVEPARRRMTQEERVDFIKNCEGSWIGEFPEINDNPPDDRDLR